MKNKVLISIAAVAALIGAGFATYATVTRINDNIAAEQSAGVSVVTDIENDILVSGLDVNRVEGETGPIFSVTGNQSQTVTFNVKAVSANQLAYGANYNIYNAINDLDSDIVDEVKAKLNLHVEVIPGTLGQDESFSPLEDKDDNKALTKYLSYFELPTKGYYSWSSWLAADCETTGFEVPFEIKWAEAYQAKSLFEQVKDSGNEEVEAAITTFKDATNGVVLQFKFSVGSVKEGYERIDKAYTGAITVNGGAITVNDVPFVSGTQIEAGSDLSFKVVLGEFETLKGVKLGETPLIDEEGVYTIKELQENTAYVINIEKSEYGIVDIEDVDGTTIIIKQDETPVEAGNLAVGNYTVSATFEDTEKYESVKVQVKDGEAEYVDLANDTLTVQKGHTYSLKAVLTEKAQEKYFVKVTKTEDVIDGTYLIVYETGKLALNGSLDIDKIDSEKDTINVTIDNNKILSSDEIIASAFTFSVKDGSLKSSKGYYIGHSGSKNTLNSSNSILEVSISIDTDGNAVINGGGTYVLRYNKTANNERFRFYTGIQEAIQLYKLEA